MKPRINNNMNTQKKSPLTEDNKHSFKTPIRNEKKPDVIAGLNVEDMIKVYDPESGKVIIEGRA